MQIHNFYPDMLPSVRNPLDCIVLSPHTIKANDFCLANLEEGDACDYQALLPSISRCKYHDRDACPQPHLFAGWILSKYHKLFHKYQ